MAAVEDLLFGLSRAQGGTAEQLAHKLEISPGDRLFRRALDLAVEQGLLVAQHQEGDCTYARPPSLGAQLLKLVDDGPISAREFSQRAHKLGISGPELGKLKLELGIETFRGPDGHWRCRHGERPAGADAREQLDARRREVQRHSDAIRSSPLVAHIMSFAARDKQ